MALLSVSTLRTRHLPDVLASDSTATTVLTALLAAAEEMAAVWLGYPAAPSAAGGALVNATWDSRAYALFLQGTADGQRLVVPLAPLTAVTSVYLSEDADWPNDGSLPSNAEEIASTDYRIEHLRNGCRFHVRASGDLGRWPLGPQAVRIVCTAGYANEAALPLGVADAVYRWCADVYTRRRVRLEESVSQGGASQTLRELGMPKDVADALLPYQLLGQLGAA